MINTAAVMCTLINYLISTIVLFFYFILLGKVNKKIALLHPQPVLCDVLKELCAIRDNISLCDIADSNDIVLLIDDIIMY